MHFVYVFQYLLYLTSHWQCFLGAADVAVRQQLSSLLFVKKMCEAKIRTLKYGDGELPSLASVRAQKKALIGLSYYPH